MSYFVDISRVRHMYLWDDVTCDVFHVVSHEVDVALLSAEFAWYTCNLKSFSAH